MPPPLLIVDAFVTGAPFSGNPAAVCLMEKPADAPWMQRLAAEMNLSETAFVHRRPDGRFGLRWFTPTQEVDLCGHATLATAHTLLERRIAHADAPIHFETNSGTLTVELEGDALAMDFPLDPPKAAEPPAGLAEAVGVRADQVVGVANGHWYMLAQVADDVTVADLTPDIPALGRIAKAVIVTSRAKAEGYDFVSRFFGPGYGVDEDPATGSAHCVLAPYWAAVLGKDRMRALQVHRRGAELDVEVRAERVILRGRARTTVVGELAPVAAP